MSSTPHPFNTTTGAPQPVPCSEVWDKYHYPPADVLARCVPGVMEIFGHPPVQSDFPSGGYWALQHARNTYYQRARMFDHGIAITELPPILQAAIDKVLPLLFQHGLDGLLVWRDKAGLLRAIIRSAVDYHVRLEQFLLGGATLQVITLAQKRLIEAGHPIDTLFYQMSDMMPGRLRERNAELLGLRNHVKVSDEQPDF